MCDIYVNVFIWVSDPLYLSTAGPFQLARSLVSIMFSVKGCLQTVESATRLVKLWHLILSFLPRVLYSFNPVWLLRSVSIFSVVSIFCFSFLFSTQRVFNSSSFFLFKTSISFLSCVIIVIESSWWFWKSSWFCMSLMFLVVIMWSNEAKLGPTVGAKMLLHDRLA